MDLLIEAIIWLFKNLFGEQEPQARLGSREEEERSRHSRGDRSSPSFGNEPAEGTGARPKTLADLLAEARQQMQGSQTERPEAPPQAARRQVMAPPEPAPAADRGTSPPTLRKLQSVPALPATPPPLPEQARAIRRAEKAAKKHREQQTARSHAAPLPKPTLATGIIVPTPPKASTPNDLAEWLASLRSPKSNVSHVAGMRALASLEILGPPRCRKPFRAR